MLSPKTERFTDHDVTFDTDGSRPGIGFAAVFILSPALWALIIVGVYKWMLP